MSAHARLGPSNRRWPKCPGSIREEMFYIDKAGEPAIDGTGSHLLLEKCLTSYDRAETFIDETIGSGHEDYPKGWLVDAERAKRVSVCIDYIDQRVQELSKKYIGCKIIVEAESISNPGEKFGRDDWWGTCDVTISVVDLHLDCSVVYVEVIDYKDGRMYVSERDNTQLMSYLYGKITDVKEGQMTIVQPKTNNPIRSQTISAVQLQTEAEMLNFAAIATDNPDAPLKAGKWCRFCKASSKNGGHCKLPEEKELLFDPVEASDDKIREFLNQEQIYLDTFAACKAEIQKTLEDGYKFEGYKMAPGRRSSSWLVDEEAVVKALRKLKLKKAEMYEKKLLSVSRVAKLLSLEEIEHIVEIKRSNPTLVKGK